jgi:hypothetical protein
MYKLRDWIDLDKIERQFLSKHPNAIDILRENPDKIDWDDLSMNPNAIDMLRANPDKINWFGLSGNPNVIDAIDLLRASFFLLKQETLAFYFASAK